MKIGRHAMRSIRASALAQPYRTIRSQATTQEFRVYMINLDDAKGDYELLSRAERERALGLRVPRVRRRWVAARTQLRLTLAHLTGTRPEQLHIRLTPDGKPELVDVSSVRFSLSHSRHLALIAVSDREVGVDVEFVEDGSRRLARVAARYLSGLEQEQLVDLPVRDQSSGFYRCWTRKEALLKADGRGMRVPLNIFSVTCAPDDARLLTSTDLRLRAFGDLRDLSVLTPGFAAALAIQVGPAR